VGLPEENNAAATILLVLAIYRSADPACINVGILVNTRLNYTVSNT